MSYASCNELYKLNFPRKLHEAVHLIFIRTVVGAAFLLGWFSPLCAFCSEQLLQDTLCAINANPFCVPP